jgi:hypothetical protein
MPKACQDGIWGKRHFCSVSRELMDDFADLDKIQKTLRDA